MHNAEKGTRVKEEKAEENRKMSVQIFTRCKASGGGPWLNSLRRSRE